MFASFRSSLGLPATPPEESPTIGSSPGTRPSVTPINISSNSIPAVVHEPQDALKQAHQQVEQCHRVYSEEVTALAETAKKEFLAIKNQIQAKQATALRRGLTVTSTHDIQTQRRNALKALATKTREAGDRAYLGYQQKVAPHQQQLDSLLLDSRQKRLSSLANSTESHLEATQQTIATSSAVAVAVLNSVPKAPTTDTQALQWARSMLQVTDHVRTLALGQYADDYLATPLGQLEEAHQQLEDFAASDTHTGLACQTETTSFKEALTQYRSAFLLAQAHSDEQALAVAKEHYSNLSQKAHDLRTLAKNAQRELRAAKESDHLLLNHQIRTFSSLAAIAEKGAQAYQEIADVYQIPFRDTTAIQAQLAGTLDKLSKNDFSEDPSKKELILKLSGVAVSLVHSIESRTPTYDLAILSHLNDITGKDDHAIVGVYGQIILDPPLSTISDTKRSQCSDGMNLIRTAILKDYGMPALQEFDRFFSAKITTENPLTIGELKEFITNRLANTHPGYFLPSDTTLLHKTLMELCKSEGSANDSKLVKAGSSFNPFSKASSSSQPSLSSNEEHLQGIEMAKEGITSYFKHLALPKEKRDAILDDFDTQFLDEDYPVPLTAGALKLFIQQKTAQYAQDITSSFLSNPVALSFAWSAFESAFSILKATPSFLALATSASGATTLFAFEFATKVLGQLTAGWRMLH